MNFSGKRAPFAFCLLGLALLGIFTQDSLLATISYLWANKGKAVKAASHLSIECMRAPTDEEFLLKNAQAGYRDAQGALAMRYLDGWDGFKKDRIEGLKWLRAAAEEGAIYPQYVMGTVYAPDIHEAKGGEQRSEISKAVASEVGIKTDYLEAATWWTRAASQGYEHAQYSLSLLYRDGLGVIQDNEEAYFWAAVIQQKYRKDYKDLEEKAAKLLSPEQLEAVNKRIAAWKPVKVQAKKSKPIINVAGLLCGKQDSLASCNIDSRCGNVVGIDCGSGNDRGGYYFANIKTKEFLNDGKHYGREGIPSAIWNCGEPKNYFH